MAGSAEVDWSSCVKPLLPASNSSFIPAEIPDVVEFILKSFSDSQLLTHDEEYEGFYSSYVALACHYLSANAGEIPKSNLSSTLTACKILLNFLLARLQDRNENCTISQKYLMILISGLCKGTASLPKSDLLTFTAMLKSAKLPPHIRPEDKEGTEEVAASSQVELKRPRLDTGVNIFDHLTSVFDDTGQIGQGQGPVESMTSDGDMTISHIPDPTEDTRKIFAAKNCIALQQLHGGPILVEACTKLVYVARYRLRYEDAIGGTHKGFVFPGLVSEANSVKLALQSLSNDLSFILRAFSLPILEPLTTDRLDSIVKVVMTCLYTALTVAAAGSIMNLAASAQVKGATATKEEDFDTYAVGIVQKSLEVFNTVLTTIQSSTRAGGHTLQNYKMTAAWLILHGLQHILHISPSSILDKPKEKEATKTKTEGTAKPKEGSTGKPAVPKSQHGFGVLAVALASQAMQLMAALMEDLSMETATFTSPMSAYPGETVVQIQGSLTAWQRVERITSSVRLTGLLFNILNVAYKKASLLKKQRQGNSESDCDNNDSDSTSSDSNTYYEDDFSCTEDSSSSSEEEDDDSEPILGLSHWFDETPSPSDSSSNLPPPPPPPVLESSASNASKLGNKIAGEWKNFIPDKKEPDGYINLATEVLQFLTQHFLSSQCEEVTAYIKSTMGDHQMSLLAFVIKELDRDCSRQENDLFVEFSTALARFLHILIASEILSFQLQFTLLQHLGIGTMVSDPWPMTVYPRSLAVLVELILLRQKREREAGCIKSKSEAAVINIWTRFLQSLKNAILNFDNDCEKLEDINVEHLQVLLFLFHGLPLMQKKTILILLGHTIISVAHIDKWKLEEMVPLPLSRLMLIFDYMLHYFYDPPASLMDQVQHNLFVSHTRSDSSVAVTSEKEYVAFKEVEDNYLKQASAQEMTMKPRFYNLAATGYNNQDTPKVDGLACSFLLGAAEDVLNYSVLYDACVTLLFAGSKWDKVSAGVGTVLEASAIHYHFLICWRLLGCLPPSAQYMHSLEEGMTEDYDAPHMLHTMRWAPRMMHKNFAGWTKDSLVKQGMTTQKAEALVSSVVNTTNNVNFDVSTALQHMQNELSNTPVMDRSTIVSISDIPSLSSIYMLDTVVAKAHVALDELFTKSMAETDPRKCMEVGLGLLPAVFQLIEAYTVYIRSSLLHQIKEGGEDSSRCHGALRAYGAVLSIGSTRASKVSVLGAATMAYLPEPVRNVIEKWNSSTANEFPAISSWRNAFANDIIPSESYIEAIQFAHVGTLSGQAEFEVNMSLKHMLQALVRFCQDLVVWCIDSSFNEDLIRVMFPLIFDSTTEYLADYVTLALERVIGPVDGEEYTSRMYLYILQKCYTLLLDMSGPECGLDEKIFHDCLKFMEMHIEKPLGKKAFQTFFTDTGDLTKVLLSASRENMSPTYSTKVLKFFNKLFQLAEKNPQDKCFEVLCSSLKKLARLDMNTLQAWLKKMIMGSPQNLEDTAGVSENRHLLQSLTSYIVKENSHVGEEVAKAILNALIPMGSQLLSPSSDGMGFSELMVVMATLAGAGSGVGHTTLFKAATAWLELCKAYLTEKNVIEKLTESVASGNHQVMMESATYLLKYIGDILSALKQSSDKSGSASPHYYGDTGVQEADSDWTEDIAQEEEDSGGEDSDEESLNNKLCTFTITQKEFMNQHWYHCHTCKMVDGVGVCTICAKVCHKDHELTYAKFGSFFCDCGAKEDGSCKAMVKRVSSSDLDGSTLATTPSPFSMEAMLPSSLRQRYSSPDTGDKDRDKDRDSAKISKAREVLCKQVEAQREVLLSHVESSGTASTVLELLQAMTVPIQGHYTRVSPVGSAARARKALEELHSLTKTVETTDQLMTATLGSQEGAFENVKINYSGEQGQQIRQLITFSLVRRIAMCCMTSVHGKRQHLAVCHEKGKITILQLSTLLKQADSSKRKLTLTRLASAPIPFTVLSIAGNPCNEDFLAVCGLKDCHILTFTSSGSVADHLVLHPQLETGNFIIKALWLPGSQTELAVVTADFVKIYDLAVDALSPQYYYLLPSGKIRDATFMFSEDSRSLVLMSSAGYVYTQVMDEASSAKHGPFYITNVLEIKHADLKEHQGQIAGGGASIYYSHPLQLLFFSYSQGKTFAAPLPKDATELPILFPITFKSSNGGSNGQGSGGSGGASGGGGGGGGKSNFSQPLVQWSEVPGHPGLVCCMTQVSNHPVILMVKPDVILLQEIKVLPSKAKIQDMVAIRHASSSSDQQRTTLILLCEDGSLRIYMANVDQTGFWMSPSMVPQSVLTTLKPAKKKKVTKTGRPTGNVSFPVDFFEHCQECKDVEFGGNDILQVYNAQQVKHRLNTSGMYIASTKNGGFSIEITNTNTNNVMVSLRVLVGSQALEMAPSHLEIFGRTTQVNISRARWFDLAFTREESLTAEKKMTLFIGPSVDPAGVTMIDSIKVYVKTKEAFGWPEDTEEFAEAVPAAAKVAVPSSGVSSIQATEEPVLPPIPLTCTDRLVASSLEVLDGCFATASSEEKEKERQGALDLATTLLTLPTPVTVTQHTKSLMATLFSSKVAYHNHKDQAQLSQVMHCLTAATKDLDAEAYSRLVVTARALAISRPSNLVRYADKEGSTLVGESALEVTDLESDDHTETLTRSMELDVSESGHFVVQLVDAFWKLHAARPRNPILAPVCAPGLVHTEATVAALVEIIHAFTSCDLDNVNLAAKLYVRMLMCDDPAVSFYCKLAMIRMLRPRHKRKRVFIPSPPRCSTPGVKEEEEDKTERELPRQPPAAPRSAQPVQIAAPELEEDEEDRDEDQYEVVEHPEPMILEPPEAGIPGGPSLEAILGAHMGAHMGGMNYPPVLDIPPDADDEAMVELAIALSLQEQGQQGGLSLQGLSLGAQRQGTDHSSHYSDTTASAPASDDEAGSTAATEGSTLRTSPAEQGGSESGGSASGSVSGEQNVSGRSSAYGDGGQERDTAGGPRSETSSIGLPSGSMRYEVDICEPDIDNDTSHRLHHLRLMLLEKMIGYITELRNIGGVRAIPFMQVLLMLTSDLDSEEERDKAVLDSLLTALLKQMDFKNVQEVVTRTNVNEVQLIILRLLSVFMSRTRAGMKPSGEPPTLISSSTAGALLHCGSVDYCLNTLKSLHSYWKQLPPDEDTASVPGQLLKSHPTTPPPDMSPFFLRQYVKGHANDVFEAYPQLLTEMVLRLPYQIKKIADASPSLASPSFDQVWFQTLSEYMMTQQTPFVKRQVRKLLLFICGSKEKYRQLRDMHALDAYMKEVRNICEKYGMNVTKPSTHPIVIPYDTLITLIEQLKSCAEIATTRTANWQKFCHKEDTILSFLIQASICLSDGVAPVLLQLLQCALCGTKISQLQAPPAGASAKAKKEKEKSEEGEEAPPKHDEGLSIILVQQVNKFVDRELLIQFMRAFLLESNSTAVRWQAHALVLHIYRNSSLSQQEALLCLMWNIWPELPSYGRKTAQFVDLLGYFVLKTPQGSDRRCKEFVEKAVDVLRGQNQILANHPNASIYNMLQGLVEFDGYYLESDPCLVCNNPEVPYNNLKLAAIKVDSKFTTTTQIVKLVGSHTISKISLKITDLKRTKMVRTLNIYYNNRSVQGIVELKNRSDLWHRAKRVTLTAGQTEAKIEFPLPIVACNLMLEYADFYDNFQASVETLQCPRCSVSVPANPGVCGNCGENVYQCHKCRAINYDEKDPFLCNSCGFCKYAKFDFTMYAKPCCAVDPIENEEDRKKAIQTINNLLEKADRVYKQLQMNRPTLETLLIRITEHGGDRLLEEVAVTTGTAAGSSVNRCIQQLAQKYCGDCKSSFDELSKIIQKVLASRKELVEYDRQQKEAATVALAQTGLGSHDEDGAPCEPVMRQSLRLMASGQCYGCSSSAVEHCVTLLRALSTNPQLRQILCEEGLIKELVNYNLRRGSLLMRNDVRQLVCLLTKDNPEATDNLNNILCGRIMSAMKNYLPNMDLGSLVRHEIMLLANTIQKEDKCWEQRISAVLKLFLLGMEIKNPTVMENVTLPCLKILQSLIKPEPPTSKKNKDKSMEALSSVRTDIPGLRAHARGWLEGEQACSYTAWKQGQPAKVPESTPKKKKEKEKEKSEEKKKEKDGHGKDADKEEKKTGRKVDKEEVRRVKVRYLMEKYGTRWKNKVKKGDMSTRQMTLPTDSWLCQAIFCPSSRSTRQTACNIVDTICVNPCRRQEMLKVLTSYLDDLGTVGESANEFLALYKRLIAPSTWKYYLAIKGLLPHIGELIAKEIDHLSVLEETTLSSDLSQGFALKALTGLLSSFVEEESIKQHYKSKLVGTVLNGYLSLRKLVVQRTKLIDETQDKLLELLEEMTTGTEEETKEFMAVCINTVKKYSLSDLRSPVFIFERLCSIIYPEENDVSEFFMSLEKDPQQEDFLQGRMLGNPYTSNEPGLGPLMRDVKNKICQDCELVALLEDDTGMELLVNNKIVSLDLPVKDVYKKIWLTNHSEDEPMRVVYRMRGLLGDATEDMVNSLDTSGDEDVDSEEVYKMAAVMAKCGGLEVMLQRMAAIRDLTTGKSLMMVLLKLFNYCVKVKVNRGQLIKPEMNAISIMLGALNLALLAEQEHGTSTTKGQTITEQILQIMEGILLEASEQTPAEYKQFSKLCGEKKQLMMLLDRINSPFVRANASVLQGLMRLIPFLAFGEEEKMLTLVNHFKPYVNFNKFDFEHTQDEQIHLDCFCVITNAIESNANGTKLKDMIVEHEIVKDAVEYIQVHAPQVKTLLATDTEDWKEFYSKPCLSYVLRLLAGLCKGHELTQSYVSRDLIPILHKLEQASSEEGVGTLAENLMETLKENQQALAKIGEIRQQTKGEKKRLAMAMRQKQLGALGMTTNEKGQVTVKSSVLKQMEDLKEETGLTCCICREGYRYQPTKVLAIYTFTKRVNLEDFENKQRKSQGYSTVSHFNVIHVDCHNAAVRHARGREEWESAALQNANTKCNGLLPLWGPQVLENAFAGALARHNSYLQECTGMRDTSYTLTLHDLKLLLLKFALEKSFSDDSGGGGRQSNVHLVPYLMHMTLYVMNTTRSVPREEKNLVTFLHTPREKWVESAYEVDGPLFWSVLALTILNRDRWKEHRVMILKRLLVLAHARHLAPGGATSLADKTVKDYAVYKPMLVFFGLLNSIMLEMYKKVPQTSEGSWSTSLAEFIRRNDKPVLEAADKMVKTYEEEMLPCESFGEFCDVMGLLEEISNPEEFLAHLLSSLP